MATLILVILFAVTVITGAIVGLIRGLNKALIRLMTLAVAAILTFLIAAPVTNTLVDTFGLRDMLLSSLGSSELPAMLDSMPLLRGAIGAAPTFLVGIVVFPLIFWVLKFITWIVFLCIQRPLRRAIFKETFGKQPAPVPAPAEAPAEETPMEETPVEAADAPLLEEKSAPVAVEKAAPARPKSRRRLAGMGVGIVTAVLIFAMLLTPILGLFSILPKADSIDILLDTLTEQDMLPTNTGETIMGIYGVTDNGLINFYGMIGFNSAGRAYLKAVSKFEAEGQTLFLSEELDALMRTAQGLLTSSDLLTSLDTQDPQALITLLSDKEALDNLLGSLFQSKMLAAAVPNLVSTAMESMASGMNVPANKEAVYNNMMDDVAQAVKDADINFAGTAAYEEENNIRLRMSRSGGRLTKEEYEAEIAKLADLTKTISKILNRSLSGDNATATDAVAQHIVTEVRVQVAENGAGALDNFDSSDVKSTLNTMDTTGVDTAVLEQLQDPDKFQTDVATVETITSVIVDTVKNALSDEDKVAETASTLAGVVSDLASAVSACMDKNGTLDPTKLDFGKIGDAVTSLQNSPLKGVGTSLLDIVASGELGSAPMVGGLLDSIKEGYEKGEDIGGTIGTAGALIGLGNAMTQEGEQKEEAMVNSLTSLIENLNEFTIRLLPDILSDEALEDMGIPSEFVEPAYGIFETLLKELLEVKDSGDYNSEVQSMLSLFDLISSGVTNFNKDTIAELADHAIASDAIYNTLLSISDSNPFGITTPDKTTRNELVKAIQDLYAASSRNEQAKLVYTAIAKLLAIDEYVKLN